jgi:hypothetical protein
MLYAAVIGSQSLLPFSNFSFMVLSNKLLLLCSDILSMPTMPVILPVALMNGEGEYVMKSVTTKPLVWG